MSLNAIQYGSEVSASSLDVGNSALDERQASPWDNRAPSALLIVALLLLGAALPVLLGLIAGSLEIPRNDDWVYRGIAMELATTGSLALHSVTTMLVGQIVLVQPLLWVSGLQPWAFTIAGVLFAFAGVLASYFLARQFLTSARAAFATLLLLIFPGYLAYSTSFMTDVPTLAAELVCLGLGVVALRHHPVRVRWLVASAVVGWFAFSIREFGIAAPASVMLCAVLAEPRRWRIWGLSLSLGGCVALLYLLKATLPNQVLGGGVGAVSATTFGFAAQLPLALASTALALLPAALIGAAWWRHVWKTFDVLIGTALGLAAVGTGVLSWYRNGAMLTVRLEDLASPLGVPGGGYLIGVRPLLVNLAAWHAMDVLAVVAIFVVMSVGSGIVGAGLRGHRGSLGGLVRGLGSPIGVLVVFTAVVTVGLAVYGVRWPLYDRYVWPLIPVVATLFLYRPPLETPSQATSDGSRVPFDVSAAAVTTLFLVVAFLFALNSLAFDSARWRAGGQLVKFGFAPSEIDAGYEWVGSHATSQPASSPVGGGETFYETWWPARRICAIARNGTQDQAGSRLIGTVDYPLYLIAGPIERLYLYTVNGVKCLPS